MRRLQRALVAAIAVAGVVATAGAPATASDDGSDAVASPAATTTHEARAVGGYWTTERMREAVPADGLAADAIAKAAASSAAEAVEAVDVGEPVTYPAILPTATPAAPISHVGKVFFTMGGQNYVCSGNVVGSANRDVVATAGHCVHDGSGAFHTNWAFVPAYDNGSRPYGTWTARNLVTTSGWAGNEDLNVDGGFAVMNDLGGQSIADATGATAIGFNLARNQSYTLYGYPAAPPFDGETLQSCAGQASDDTFGGSNSQGVSCDVTGGSSGGPWFLGNGTQNSVNSFGYTFQPGVMYGPYFGAEIQGAYDYASGA